MPIESDVQYYVWQKMVHPNSTNFVRIPTSQQMVIFKNLSLDTTICYLLTLIPDYYYLEYNKDKKEEFRHGDAKKGTFTGSAVYHTLSGELVTTYFYYGGKVESRRDFRYAVEGGMPNFVWRVGWDLRNLKLFLWE